VVLNQSNPTDDLLPVALWVAPVADLGGVARHFIDVAKAGIPGYRLVFLVPSGELADALDAAGADVIQGNFGVAAGLPKSIRSLRRAAITRGVKVVHTHLAFADIAAALTPLPRGVVRISSEHGIADPEIYQSSALKARLMKAVHHWRSGRFARIIAVAKSTADVMAKHWKPKTPVALVYNGVDTPEGSRRPAGDGPATRILSLSRLSHEKRIGELLRGFAEYQKRHPEAVLTVAGTGPDQDELRGEAKRLGIWKSVEFPGFIDAATAMQDAQVLVQLSKWENCSYTLVDARVRGLGIVATRVGGNPEIVSEASLIDDLEPTVIADAIERQSVANLTEAWPSVAQMCAQIAAVYREVARV
jgi:glycogen(starch) synthase